MLQDNLRSFLASIELQRCSTLRLRSSIEARNERRLSARSTEPKPHLIMIETQTRRRWRTGSDALKKKLTRPDSVAVKLRRSSSLLRAPRESKAPTSSEHSIWERKIWSAETESPLFCSAERALGFRKAKLNAYQTPCSAGCPRICVFRKAL